MMQRTYRKKMQYLTWGIAIVGAVLCTAVTYEAKVIYEQRAYDLRILAKLHEHIEGIVDNYGINQRMDEQVDNYFVSLKDLSYWSGYSTKLRKIQEDIDKIYEFKEDGLSREEIAHLEEIESELKDYIQEMNQYLNTKYKYQRVVEVISFDKESERLRQIFE